jgi:hypothetical protein
MFPPRSVHHAEVGLRIFAARVRVVLDEIAVEEANRLRRRRGGQPDEEGVEVVEYPPPQTPGATESRCGRARSNGANRDQFFGHAAGPAMQVAPCVGENAVGF